jgi:hypothetical protein
MPWARFDDRYPSHRKIRKLSDAAFRLDVSAVCWSAENLTDGFIAHDDLMIVADVRDPESAAEELVARGRWEVRPGGWAIHDYLEYNPSAEQVKSERTQKTARQQRWRQRARSTDGTFHVDASTDASHDAEATRLSTPPRPVPDPTHITTPPSSADADDEATNKPNAKKRKPRPAITEPEAFAAFWKAYPRRVRPANAEKAWNTALAAGADPAAIIAGAEFYALEKKMDDPKYVAHPASWLNARGWQDEPDRAYQPPIIGAPSEAASMQPAPYRAVRARQDALPHTGNAITWGDAYGRHDDLDHNPF